MLLHVNGALYIHILGAETGFERRVDLGNVKEKRGVCIYIRPMQTQGGSYICKMCNKPL